MIIPIWILFSMFAQAGLQARTELSSEHRMILREIQDVQNELVRHEKRVSEMAFSITTSQGDAAKALLEVSSRMKDVANAVAANGRILERIEESSSNILSVIRDIALIAMGLFFTAKQGREFHAEWRKNGSINKQKEAAK